MKILFAGGGTGGHIIPIISIVREIKRLYPAKDLRIFYIGPKDIFSTMIFFQEGLEVRTILTGKLRRYIGLESIFKNAVDIFIKIPIGFLQAFLQVFFLAPDLVISKGGYGSFPTVISAWLLQVPIFLHESDVAPGLVNRITSKLALEIFVSFPKTEYFDVKKSIIVGNPIRREILQGSKEEGQKKFHITGEKPIIFVMGGSQGAQYINDVILAALPEMLTNFEILHQTGESNFKAVKAEAEVVMPKGLERFYHPVPFLKEQDLKHAYQICDLIVARAGSGTIFEIAAIGKPSILVPLQGAAQNHQYKNAYAYAAQGAALVMEEANFFPHFFLEKLKYLFSNPDELEKMKKSALEFAKPEAAQVIAEYILGYLTQ